MPIASRFRRQYLSAKWDRKLLINEPLKTAEIENGNAVNSFYSLSIDNTNVSYAVHVFYIFFCLLYLTPMRHKRLPLTCLT